MKRSLFLKVGAVVLALTALLLVLPNTAQVSDPFVAQVDAAAAARFVSLHPEQYANFFVEQTDATVAYCIDKTALYAFKEFEKTSSSLFANASGTATSKEAQPLRVASLKEVTHQAELKTKSEETIAKGSSVNADQDLPSATDRPGKTEDALEAVEREIQAIEPFIKNLPPGEDHPSKGRYEELLNQRAKLLAQQEAKN